MTVKGSRCTNCGEKFSQEGGKDGHYHGRCPKCRKLCQCGHQRADHARNAGVCRHCYKVNQIGHCSRYKAAVLDDPRYD